MERTLILLKPDAVQRSLAGHILSRFEAKGLKIVAMKMLRVDQALAQKHYAAHEGKDFYNALIEYITAGPVVAAVLEGPRAVKASRTLMGATFGHDAEAGTIRGDLALSSRYNLVHGSDSPEAAQKEIALFFEPEELIQYDRPADQWRHTRSDSQPA